MLCYTPWPCFRKSLQCSSTKPERSKGLITFIPILTPPIPRYIQAGKRWALDPVYRVSHDCVGLSQLQGSTNKCTWISREESAVHWHAALPYKEKICDHKQWLLPVVWRAVLLWCCKPLCLLSATSGTLVRFCPTHRCNMPLFATLVACCILELTVTTAVISMATTSTSLGRWWWCLLDSEDGGRTLVPLELFRPLGGCFHAQGCVHGSVQGEVFLG